MEILENLRGLKSAIGAVRFALISSVPVPVEPAGAIFIDDVSPRISAEA